MGTAFIGFALAMVLYNNTAPGCFILNEEKVQVGSRPAIKGICSNNRLPVTCLFREGTGIECDGPSGGYTGYDIDSLVFSACGCSIEKEKELHLKKELEKQ